MKRRRPALTINFLNAGGRRLCLLNVVGLSTEANEDKQYPISQKKSEDHEKLRSLPDSPREHGKNELHLRPWSELPVEMLEKAFFPLTLKENIRASATCRWWKTIAATTRVINKPPWLMYFPKEGDVCDFYDPYTRRTFSTEIKGISKERTLTSKYGWLLIYDPDHIVTFFNPFTREIIPLPALQTTYQVMSFSCPPTDPSCMVLAVKHITSYVVSISCCNITDKEWSTTRYYHDFPFISSVWNKLVFAEGMFYCLSLTGCLGVFDPKERTWNVLDMSPPICPRAFYGERWWRGRFLSEYEGELLMVCTCLTENPFVFKLNRTAIEWERVHSLDDVTFFAGFYSSISRNDLPGTMRDRIYFPKVRFYGKQCTSYSLGKERFYPQKQSKDWGAEEQYRTTWIDPPNDLSTMNEFSQVH